MNHFTFINLFLFWVLFTPLLLNSQSKLQTIIIDPGHGLPDPGSSGEFSEEHEVVIEIAKKLAILIKDSLTGVNVFLTRETSVLPGGKNNSTDALYYRADFANEKKGDLFISIHADSRAPIYKKIGKRNIKVKDTIKGASIYIIAAHKTKDKDDAILDHIDIVSEDPKGFDSRSPYALALAANWTKKFFKNSLIFAEMIDKEFNNSNRRTWGVKQRNRGIWVLQATSMPSVLVETGYLCTSEEEVYLNSSKGQFQTAYCIFRALKNYKKFIENN